MVEVKNGNFVINGRDTFLFGGEIHYFRVPRQDWENRIIRAKQAGANLVSSYIPWLIHEYEEGDIDLEGRRRPENDLGAFLQLIKKHHMYCILRPGPYIMSEMCNEGLPNWIYTSYPQSLAKDREGKDHPTRSVYLLDEDYLNLVDRWYAALGKIIRPYTADEGGPVIMLQLDNEIGMMHWCAGQADYTPRNILDFHDYLREKKGDQETVYGSREGEEFQAFVCHPPKEAAAVVRDDLSRYMRQYFRRYFEALQTLARQYMGTVPNIVNVHGFDSCDVIKRGKQYPIGVSQLSEVAKVPGAVMAGDYYIGNICYDNFQDIMLANAYTHAVQSPDQPLFSAEFQGGFQVDTPRMQPTTYDLTTRLCVAGGMNGVNYYMFAGGYNMEGTGYYGHRHSWQAPVDMDGSLNPQYPVIQHLGRMLHACEQSLLTTRQEAVVTLGLIPDYYMTEYADAATQAFRDELAFYRNEYLFEGMGKGMSVTNLIYEGYDLSAPQPISVREHPKLAAFATRYMEADVQQRLVDYVMAGGRLLLFPTVPVMDMRGEPCTILRDALGCKAEVHDFGFAAYIDDVEDIIISSSTDLGDVENGFAKQKNDGYTCGFVKEMGKGKAVVFGVAQQHDYYYRDQVVLNQFAKIGVKPLFTADHLSDKLFMTSRVNKDGGRYLFINNIDEYAKETHIHFRGRRLFGGKKLIVRPRSGLMLPLNIQFRPEAKILYSTAEILESKDVRGEWRLTLSLTQPEDEILVETSFPIIPDDAYQVEKTAEGWRICSKLHGALYDTLTIRFSQKAKK